VRLTYDDQDIAAGAAPQFGGTRVWYIRQPDGAFMMWTPGTDQHVVIRGQGFNFFDVSDDGRWVGYRADPPRLIWFDDVEWVGWADGDIGTTRWAARTQATGALYAGTGNGQNGKLIDGRATTDVRIEGDVLAWRVAGRIYAQRHVDAPIEDWSIEGLSHYWPVPVLDYVLTHTEDERLLLYRGRERQTHGHVVATGVTDFPDAKAIDATHVRVRYSVRGERREVIVDLSKPEVDLRVPSGPVEDTSGQILDLWEYFLPHDGVFPRTSGIPTHGHEMHCTFDGRNLHLLPFGEPDHWVRMVVEHDTLTFREDRSRDGQSTGDYSFTSALWARRRMVVGDRIVNARNNLVRYQADGCQIVKVHAFPFITGVWKRWTSFDCGGHLGWQDVIAYLYDPGGNADIYELSYYAKGYGFFRWEEYDQKTGALNHWTTFNEFGGRAPQPTQGCWQREHLDLTPENWPPKPDPKPDPKPETRIMASFKTANGNYLCAEEGGGREVNATRTAAGGWETFEVVPHEGGVAIKASNGQYWCAENGGGGALNANRDTPGAWERFTVVKVDGGVALQSIDGYFVCAEGGGGGQVNVTRTAAGAWETFDAPDLAGTHGGGGGGGGTHAADSIQGQLRIEASAFVDDAGLVLPILCHFGDALSRWTRGHQGDVAATLDDIASAGYHGIRFWSTLGLDNSGGGFWAGRQVGPTYTPDYWAHVEAFLTALRDRGLVCQLSQGDVRAVAIPDRRAFAYQMADVVNRVGTSVVALFEGANESRDTGEPDAGRLAQFVSQFHERCPAPLCALSAYTGTEDMAILNDFSRSPANLYVVHSYRGGRFADKIRHIFSIVYEGKPQKRLGWNGEGPGFGDLVSAIDNKHEIDANVYSALAIMALITRQGYVWFSGPGVISDHPNGERLQNMPGFREVPQVRALLPADVMRYGEIWHGGDDRPWSSRRAFRAVGEMRADHVVDGNRFVCLMYGPGGLNLPQNRALRVDRDITFGDKARLVVGEFA
jgi:hypothetical protein